MVGTPLFERLEPWIEGYMGAPLSALGPSPVPVTVRQGRTTATRSWRSSSESGRPSS